MNYNIGINNGDVVNNINNNSENNKIIDHLVITVHGIGKHEEKWNEKIIKMNTVYQNVTKITERNKNVKFVGLEWHSGVHKKTDQFIKKVTPNSIPVVRELINHTLLDILLFTSPAFSQHIYTEVGTKLNSIYKEFLESNPTFKGKVSILAHSLGSVICYDILCHQLNSISKIDSSTDSTTSDYGLHTAQDKGNIFYWKKLRDEQLKLQIKQQQQSSSQQKQPSEENSSDNEANDDDKDDDTDSCGSVDVEEDLKKCLLGVNFPKLEFDVFNLYCIGSPIGLFCTVRGHQFIDIPKCINLYNIYDQSDPVASLLEPLVDEGFQDAGESMAPHFSSKKKQPVNNRNSQNVSSTVISSSSSTSSTLTTNTISNNGNNNNNITNTTSTITVTSNNNNSNNNSTFTSSSSSNNNGSNSPSISMFSKLTSKLNSVIGKNSNTTTSVVQNDTTPNNTALQLTTQKPLPSTPSSTSTNSSSSSFIMVEETEMASFDGASRKRTSSFNGSSIPSSDSEFDDTSSEKSDKGEKSSYNLYIENQQLDTGSITPQKKLIPNKSLPMTPQQQPSTTNTTTIIVGGNNNNNNGRFFGGYRFDYKLKQTGVFSQLSDYSSVFNAHKSYWLSNDVMYFINSSL